MRGRFLMLLRGRKRLSLGSHEGSYGWIKNGKNFRIMLNFADIFFWGRGVLLLIPSWSNLATNRMSFCFFSSFLRFHADAISARNDWGSWPRARLSHGEGTRFSTSSLLRYQLRRKRKPPSPSPICTTLTPTIVTALHSPVFFIPRGFKTTSFSGLHVSFQQLVVSAKCLSGKPFFRYKLLPQNTIRKRLPEHLPSRSD